MILKFRFNLKFSTSFFFFSLTNHHSQKPKHVQFEYPDLYGGDRVKLEDEIGKLEKQFEFIKKREKRRMFAENRHNVPGWF